MCGSRLGRENCIVLNPSFGFVSPPSLSSYRSSAFLEGRKSLTVLGIYIFRWLRCESYPNQRSILILPHINRSNSTPIKLIVIKGVGVLNQSLFTILDEINGATTRWRNQWRTCSDSRAFRHTVHLILRHGPPSRIGAEQSPVYRHVRNGPSHFAQGKVYTTIGGSDAPAFKCAHLGRHLSWIKSP